MTGLCLGTDNGRSPEPMFENRWSYRLLVAIAIVYGLGGVMHIANMAGFGEQPWLESPMSWRLGDVWWGSLDLIGFVRKVIATQAVGLAAVTQVAA